METDIKLSQKVLELVAREIGEAFTGTEIVSILKDFGILEKDIQYPNTKWVTVLQAFNHLEEHFDDPDYEIACLVQKFINPLQHEPNPENAHLLAKNVQRFLAYDKFTIDFDEIEGTYDITAPSQQTDWNDVGRFEEQQKDKETEDILSSNKEELLSLRDLHQAYMDVIELFCQSIHQPENDLNKAYSLLSEKIPQAIDDLKIRYHKIDFFRPFAGDLYSAELEWNGSDELMDFRIGPKLSWDAVRPKLYKAHSDIVKLISLAEKQEELTTEEKDLDIVSSVIAKHRNKIASEKDIQNKAENVFKHLHSFENSIQEKPIELKQVPEKNHKKHSFPFTIPSGTTWENIYIQFKNREAVTITTSGHSHDTSFADMGFADGRDGKPNVQWYLLLLFAKHGGTLTAGNPDARAKYKKQKQNLAKALKKYFGIDYDPFKPYGKSDGYQIKINLAPPTRVEEVEEEESVSEEIDEMFRNLS